MSKRNTMPDYDPVPSQRGGASRPPKKKKKKKLHVLKDHNVLNTKTKVIVNLRELHVLQKLKKLQKQKKTQQLLK